MKTRNVSDLFGTKLYLEKIWAEKQRGGEGSSSLGLHFSTFFLWQTFQVSAPHFQLETKHSARLHVLLTTIHIKYFLCDDSFVSCDPHALSAESCTQLVLPESSCWPLGSK